VRRDPAHRTPPLRMERHPSRSRLRTQWLPPHILGEDLAHLEVRSIHPQDAPLPITETGYRSHFIAASAVGAAGGPAAYVDAWLTAEGDSPAWRERDQAAR